MSTPKSFAICPLCSNTHFSVLDPDGIIVRKVKDYSMMAESARVPSIFEEVDVRTMLDTTKSLTKSQVSRGIKRRVRSFSAIPDKRYDKLLQCLTSDSMVGS